MPVATHYGRMVEFGGRLFLFGGFDGFQNTTSVFSYDLRRLSFPINVSL